MIASLSQVFSATAIAPQAPGDSPSNDILKLADSCTTSALHPDGKGNSVQVTNSVWGVRSFSNQADFYLILQEVDYRTTGNGNMLDTAKSSVWVADETPTLIQTSPQSTACSESITRGFTVSEGGSAGWNQSQGVNATATAGFTGSLSETMTCPNVQITDYSDPASGQTFWNYLQPPQGEQLNTYYNLWIWELPFSQYQEGQQLLLMRSEAVQGSGFANGLLVSMVSGIPMPFGDTFSLQQPVVSSVSPTCVNAGDNFTINGTGFYPSMLSKVLIYNTSAHYTPVSDRQIQVVAPDLSGYELPVIVQTAKGQSNDDVKIEISVIHACDFK